MGIMKKIWLSVFIVLAYTAVAAQAVDTVPPYKKDPNIPAFLIQQADSSWFSLKDLPKYDYTAIIYFSPTCGHCQIMAKDIADHKDSLKNMFFIFVSFNPLNDIKGFSSYYGLDGMTNMRIGRDPKYHIPSFYRVQYTPFTAIYDSKRKLIQVYDPPHRNAAEAADLIQLVHKN
jgi:thioredoxin-related protein